MFVRWWRIENVQGYQVNAVKKKEIIKKKERRKVAG
jgi:hypothetical protein